MRPTGRGHGSRKGGHASGQVVDVIARQFGITDVWRNRFRHFSGPRLEALSTEIARVGSEGPHAPLTASGRISLMA